MSALYFERCLCDMMIKAIHVPLCRLLYIRLKNYTNFYSLLSFEWLCFERTLIFLVSFHTGLTKMSTNIELFRWNQQMSSWVQKQFVYVIVSTNTATKDCTKFRCIFIRKYKLLFQKIVPVQFFYQQFSDNFRKEYNRGWYILILLSKKHCK